MDDGKPKRKIPKGGMVYNEWGELVDPEELKADPASKNMDVRGMLRLITLNWHYIVSSSIFYRSSDRNDSYPLKMHVYMYHTVAVLHILRVTLVPLDAS